MSDNSVTEQQKEWQAAIASNDVERLNNAAVRLASDGNLGIVELFDTAQRLSGAQRNDHAQSLYRVWLDNTKSPLAYAAWFNLAVLQVEGDQAAAEASYRAALAQNPQFVEGLLNLGTLLERMKRPEESLELWHRAVNLSPPNTAPTRALRVQALNNIGRLQEILKRMPEAEAALAESLRLEPDQRNVITHWVHLRQKQCNWPVFDQSIGITERKLLDGTSALAMLSASPEPIEQVGASQRYVEEKVLKGVAPMATAGYKHERLRIGYLSSDFCSHAVSILTAELYGLHDRSKFEVFGFCWSREDGSPLRARVIAGMDHHIRIGALSDLEAAQLIRACEIDILVDLHGLTLNARHNILSYRPAPVQVTWLGLPGPTALPEIDYVISDPFVMPPELEPFFTEKPLHMPHTFQINDRQRQIGPKPSRQSCGLPEDAYVFCAFNNTFKIIPEVFDSWMRIMHAVPHSVLWLVADGDIVRTNLQREAKLRGIDPDRLLFAARVAPADYLARFQVADLFLDTSPFGGGTTASDALWAGLPVLTCAGKTFSSRMAGSLLRAVGLPELVTFTMADYEALAIKLGNDRAATAELHKKLDDNRLTAPLFDSERFVRDLEERFLEIVVDPDRAIAPNGFPLVSILIPTHNRPDYCELALKSALAQTYPNVEIIISDNSDDEATRTRFAPYIAKHPQIRYYRVPGYSQYDNGVNCLKHSRGDYFNYLMDDDLFHPDKIMRMMSFMLTDEKIGLVTSFRQLIDAVGNDIAPIPGTERLFETEVRLNGAQLGHLLLTGGRNLIGEPTTVLIRKSAMEQKFGVFTGRQYMVLSDVATWLAILTHHDAVYLPETLSYFRLHGLQDQRGNGQAIRANVDWIQLYSDALQHGRFLESPTADEQLASKLTTCIWYLGTMREEIRNGNFDVARIEETISHAMRMLLTKPAARGAHGAA
ncbi:O-linked N-acetylglucosamine transferase family protein [Pseudoduganella rivuli]|uniref:O-linked N-acetylglucosamine transferase family protein n=1 Tax=Pseudoduganella rivuli TaxID=2666085 RepID=UPI0018A20662|nr:glycosyltransferase [Pseudoduganella rivuli]